MEILNYVGTVLITIGFMDSRPEIITIGIVLIIIEDLFNVTTSTTPKENRVSQKEFDLTLDKLGSDLDQFEKDLEQVKKEIKVNGERIRILTMTMNRILEETICFLKS